MGQTEYVSIGYIRRAHGVKGSILVESLTDNPARFENLFGAYVEINGRRTHFRLEKCLPASKGWILKFQGIDEREQAEDLKGGYIEIDVEQLPELENGVYYVFELIGMGVYSASGELLGEITDVQRYPANDVYVVEGNKGKLLLPAIRDVVRKVDVKRKRMEIELLDGLEFE